MDGDVITHDVARKRMSRLSRRQRIAMEAIDHLEAELRAAQEEGPVEALRQMAEARNGLPEEMELLPEFLRAHVASMRTQSGRCVSGKELLAAFCDLRRVNASAYDTLAAVGIGRIPHVECLRKLQADRASSGCSRAWMAELRAVAADFTGAERRGVLIFDKINIDSKMTLRLGRNFGANTYEYIGMVESGLRETDKMFATAAGLAKAKANAANNLATHALVFEAL
jgi:hypothetical protein